MNAPQPSTSSSVLDRRHPLCLPVVFVGGLIFGFGLALSRMVRPEVVLDFLQLDDLGLLFVMGGAALLSGLAFFGASGRGGRAPLTGLLYTRMARPLAPDIVVGGGIFGVGWGLSGVCPGAAYASLGVGNYPILLAIAGMFLGAYLHAVWDGHRRSQAGHRAEPEAPMGVGPSFD